MLVGCIRIDKADATNSAQNGWLQHKIISSHRPVQVGCFFQLDGFFQCGGSGTQDPFVLCLCIIPFIISIQLHPFMRTNHTATSNHKTG